MFLINSRSHRLSETSSRSGCFSLHATKAHLIPKLRCQFAEFLLLSSLKRLSIFSSPTSVGLRYGPAELELRGFSWKHIQSLRSKESSMLCLGDSLTDLPVSLLRSQTGISNTRMIFNTPSPLRHSAWSRNITLFPSVTLLSLTLGADSPCSDERRAGNLGLTASGLFTRFNVTHVSIRTSDTSSNPYESPSQAYRTLPYHSHTSVNPRLRLLT